MFGYLEIVFGCMFSGKTSTLIENLNKYISTRKEAKVLLINYLGDDRDSESKTGILTSHAYSSKSLNLSYMNFSTSQIPSEFSHLDIFHQKVSGLVFGVSRFFSTRLKSTKSLQFDSTWVEVWLGIDLAKNRQIMWNQSCNLALWQGVQVQK